PSDIPARRLTNLQEFFAILQENRTSLAVMPSQLIENLESRTLVDLGAACLYSRIRVATEIRFTEVPSISNFPRRHGRSTEHHDEGGGGWRVHQHRPIS